MAFATRADLLARCNARRLAQLAIPADNDMPPPEAMRIAIDGGNLSGYSTEQQTALTLGVAVIDQALSDAGQLLLGYGLPDTAASSLITRLCCTVALYYLQGDERVTEDILKLYQEAVATLKSFRRGDIELVPTIPTDPIPSSDLVTFVSKNERYLGWDSNAFEISDPLDDPYL